MNESYRWAQICIIHDKGFAITGNGYSITSTSKNPPLEKLNKNIPVIDLQNIPITKWQPILRDYTAMARIVDMEFLLEDLDKLKKEFSNENNK